nr:MAG TPA: hypothetical protein [Caudoviricetes sp.]
MATRLGDMAVGSTVKIKVNGTLTDFIIVQQGSPGSGNNDFDGTWVLLLNVWSQESCTDYTAYRGYRFSETNLYSYLNNTFFTAIDEQIRSNIREVYLCDGYDESNNFINCKIFPLAGTEVGTHYNISGLRKLAYFSDGPSSSDESYSKRVAYYDNSASDWWIRDYIRSDNQRIITEHGSISSAYPKDYHGVRPAFILNPDLCVASNGMVGTIPGITTDATDLGEQNAPFTVAYTATDTGTGTLTITEKLDGEVKLTRTEVAPGTALTVDWLAEKVGYQQVLNGAHTITLEVDNGIMTATKSITFTKNVTGAKVSLTAPLTADDTITVAALTLEGSFPADMSLSVELSNNARDETPVWENCTDIQRGESRAFAHHAFANKTAAKGAAFNYKVTITRGASGVGGNITMIGGVIG